MKSASARSRKRRRVSAATDRAGRVARGLARTLRVGFASDVAKTLQAWGRERFDFLVNNAGHSLHVPFVEMTEPDFDAMVNVGFKGVYFLTQKLLPLMNDGGRIVNLSSGLARVPMGNSSGYGAVKGAIEVFTRYLAKELAPRKITANVVAPGPIETDFSGGRHGARQP
jgi:NAD(P)-dependent dehydrogenase (short-subunit alcohol dehydrogenase family)